MIELREATVVYPGAETPALHDVSLQVSPGTVVGLVGANGSGKSTLARLCNALLLPTSGAVLVDGMDTRAEDAVWDIRSRVGFVQQNPENQIVGTVVEEDVAFGPENLGIDPAELRVRVDESLAVVRLTGLERREPHLLSEGQKQRLAIAGALALRPSYLVLDEPTAMLDGVGRADVLEALRELRRRGVGVLHVTHHLEDVLDADTLVVLDAGRIAFAGTPADFLGDSDRAAALGIEIPAVVALASHLRERGVSVPPVARSAEAIVDALWD